MGWLQGLLNTRGAALQSCRRSSPQTGGNGRLALSLTGLHSALIHPKHPREKLADIAMSWEEPSIPEELWKHLGFLFLCGRAASGGTSCRVTGGQDRGSSDAGGGFLKLHKENISIKKTLLG